MPGPTTGAINEDVKVLREDLHKVETSLTAEIHRVDVAVEKLSSEFHFAKWLIGLLLAGTMFATLSGLGTGIWWASRIDSRASSLETRFDRLETRFDRLEATIAKVLEQTRPAAKP